MLNLHPRHDTSVFQTDHLALKSALIVTCLLWSAMSPCRIDAAEPDVSNIRVGVAKIDITPASPIRLSGYGSRTQVSEGVAQPLFAKAMAIGEDDNLSVFVTLEAIGIPRWVTDALAQRLKSEANVSRSNLVVAATHTHSAPALHGNLPFMFRDGVLPEERKEIERYTKVVLEKLGQVARKAIANRQPCKLDWTKGKASFAVNRRVLKDGTWAGFGVQADGPVDHSLPLIRVKDTEGQLVALLSNYACHCTTLGGDFNQVHGDWAGVAQREIETRHPGTIAMIAIGCGADQNPNPRSTLENAIAHGHSIADEVDRLLDQDSMAPITTAPTGVYEEIDLPLESPTSREEFEKQIAEKSRDSYFARAMLDRLDRGETLETSVPYPVQSWTFGDDLAMVFLAGEVVVDYAHRFYREYDDKRLWINAYCNDVPCYIPSKRLYAEGGYELDGSMVYYGKPARLDVDTEDRIAGAVMKQIPRSYHSEKTKLLSPGPVSKSDALNTIRVSDDFVVELVAAEPLVKDPIDIAWGADGRLWVVEMADYPTGTNGEPGGRVRVLTDVDHNGIYDHSEVFLDQLAFPNAVMPWRDGVLVVTANGLQFSVDTNNDGKADKTESVLTGFDSGNAQHQFGGLTWGLDHYLHVANGVGKGTVTSTKTGQQLNVGSRDLRFDPVTGRIDPLSGKTQFGLSRDDWGNWFGCNNSNPWWHYPLADRYLRRNRHVAYPNTRVLLGSQNPAPPVFPTSRTTSRFNDYDAANRFTSACSVTPYRDRLLGDQASNSLFAAEPVHNLVSRIVIAPRGSSFVGQRTRTEQKSEFFSSTDNWCRPTSIRTGPDGAIYIVDMYREVIEHPEWIPDRWQWRLDLRSGSDKGRVYRIRRKETSLRPIKDLTLLSSRELVSGLDTANGTQRDLIHQLLLEREDSESFDDLRQAIVSMQSPEGRAQALAILQGLAAIDEPTLLSALRDEHPGVRRLAIQMSEPFLADANESISTQVHRSVSDADGFVRQQLAYSLGESTHQASADVLAKLIRETTRQPSREGGNTNATTADPYLIAAMVSSFAAHHERLIDLMHDDLLRVPSAVSHALVRTSVGESESAANGRLLNTIAVTSGKDVDRWRLLSLAISTLKSRGQYRKIVEDRAALESVLLQIAAATQSAQDPTASLGRRIAGIELFGADDANLASDVGALQQLIEAREPSAIQAAAARQLIRIGDATLVDGILNQWKSLGLSARESLLGSMIQQRKWTSPLLAALKTHPLPLRSIDSAQRSALLNHADAKIQASAKSLLKSSQDVNRAAIVKRFSGPGPEVGDRTRGQKHFQRLCSACHRINEIGIHIGPDLAALTNRSQEALLTAIIDPNQAVESKYTSCNVLTEDGRSVTGLMSSETGTSITLLTAENKPQTILRSEIELLVNNGISLMPEKLEETLDEQSMADLIAFLQNTGSAKKIQVESSGTLLLNARDGFANGPSVAFNAQNDSLSWISAQDGIQWNVEKLPAGRYSVFFDAGLSGEDRLPSPMFELRIGESVVHGTVEPTGKLNRLRKRQFAEVTLPSDLTDVTVQFHHRLRDAEVSIRQIAIIPVQ